MAIFPFQHYVWYCHNGLIAPIINDLMIWLSKRWPDNWWLPSVPWAYRIDCLLIPVISHAYQQTHWLYWYNGTCVVYNHQLNSNFKWCYKLCWLLIDIKAWKHQDLKRWLIMSVNIWHHISLKINLMHNALRFNIWAPIYSCCMCWKQSCYLMLAFKFRYSICHFCSMYQSCCTYLPIIQYTVSAYSIHSCIIDLQQCYRNISTARNCYVSHMEYCHSKSEELNAEYIEGVCRNIPLYSLTPSDEKYNSD